MNGFLLYLLYASVCMVLFYCFYVAALRRLTFFKWNRLYLLSTLALSAIIPMLNIRIGVQQEAPVNDLMPVWSIELHDNSVYSSQGLNWGMFVIAVYFVGATLMLVQFIASLYKINKAWRQNEYARHGKMRIVNGTTQINNCSFFNTVFLDRALLSTAEYEQVLSHEDCHVRLHHTYDKLFAHLMQIIFWFNPVAYLYRLSIEEVHEFQADAMSASEYDRQSYANLLLQIIMKKQPTLLNRFSRQSMKSRMQMLFTRRSNRINFLKYVTGMLLLAFTTMSFGIRPYIIPEGKAVKIPRQNDFYSKTTTINGNGREVDVIRLRFGNNHLVGAVRKGGKLLFLIHGKKYEEEDLAGLSKEQTDLFSCPCSVQIIDRDTDPLLYEQYDGVIEIKGK
jgi:BlaR1 peptidase M56